jgi:hypothetical protein
LESLSCSLLCEIYYQFLSDIEVNQKSDFSASELIPVSLLLESEPGFEVVLQLAGQQKMTIFVSIV